MPRQSLSRRHLKMEETERFLEPGDPCLKLGAGRCGEDGDDEEERSRREMAYAWCARGSYYVGYHSQWPSGSGMTGSSARTCVCMGEWDRSQVVSSA
jgi:hypothetical protein